MTCRAEVLEAFFRLERKTGNREFRLKEIVDEVLSASTGLKESTIRTHVVSVMCRDAPINHLLVFDDLERIDRGIYRRKRL